MTIIGVWLLAAAAAQAAPVAVKQADHVAPAAGAVHALAAVPSIGPSAVVQGASGIVLPQANALLGADAATAREQNAALPSLEAFAQQNGIGSGGLISGGSFSTLYDHADDAPGEDVTVGERTFAVGRFLGKGDTTLVHRLANPPKHALRRPRTEPWVDTPAGRMPMPWFMDQFIDGHQPLADAGVPIVALHEHKRGEFAIVDYVDGPLLRDFLRHPRLFTPIESDKMLKALEVFAAKTAAFAVIGDFKSEQMLYDETLNHGEGGWVLFDWMANHQMHDAENTGDTFMNVYREKSFNHLDGFDHQARAWIKHVLGVAHDAVARARKKG